MRSAETEREAAGVKLRGVGAAERLRRPATRQGRFPETSALRPSKTRTAVAAVLEKPPYPRNCVFAAHGQDGRKETPIA